MAETRHAETLPSSPAAERNSPPIHACLLRLLSSQAHVLEIGSGTAQHAVYISERLPRLLWQCSDVAENLPGIQARIELQAGQRLPAAIELDVIASSWPKGPFDAVFTANTLHIMPWDHTPVLLQRSSAVLRPGGCLIIYGPFHDNGIHTAATNEAFDGSLKARAPAMGVRDAVQIKALASAVDLGSEADLALPANNRLLVFRKLDGAPT